MAFETNQTNYEVMHSQVLSRPATVGGGGMGGGMGGGSSSGGGGGSGKMGGTGGGTPQRRRLDLSASAKHSWRQGLTLVRFSAQSEHIFRDELGGVSVTKTPQKCPG